MADNLFYRMAKEGIRVPQMKYGEQRISCPQCSQLRRKKHQRTLSVKIDERGCYFNCWHCTYSGVVWAEDKRSSRTMAGGHKKAKSPDMGAAIRRLRNGILPGA